MEELRIGNVVLTVNDPKDLGTIILSPDNIRVSNLRIETWNPKWRDIWRMVKNKVFSWRWKR